MYVKWTRLIIANLSLFVPCSSLGDLGIRKKVETYSQFCILGVYL